MIEHIGVIGHPSPLGGADTELDHQIDCWSAMGIEVHLCPNGPLDENLKAMSMQNRGCVYHDPQDWPSLEGLHCISFCNGDYLKHIEDIKHHARSTSFVNCMSWNFDAEVEAQERELIDFHLYQTEHAFDKVSRKLKDRGTYRPLFFKPYFNTKTFPFVDDRPQDKFRFGHISRDDGDKFGSRQLWIYETMTAPVLKEGLILGWGKKAVKKFGRQPESFITTLLPGAISQRAFYAQCEAIIMTTDTFENLPRVGFEAMASGSILVVDDRGGWQLEVEDGITGWLCKDDREFVYKASRCAFEKEERDRMRIAAREKLEQEWGLQAAMDSWAQVFEEWEKLETSRSQNVSSKRNLWSNIAVWHLNLWMYTLVELYCWNRPRASLVHREDSPWDDPQRRPSHADRRKALQAESLSQELNCAELPRPIREKFRKVLHRLLRMAI